VTVSSSGYSRPSSASTTYDGWPNSGACSFTSCTLILAVMLKFNSIGDHLYYFEWSAVIAFPLRQERSKRRRPFRRGLGYAGESVDYF
jgi:hypothetical protein